MSWFGISLGLSIVLPQMLELYEQVLPFPISKPVHTQHQGLSTLQGLFPFLHSVPLRFTSLLSYSSQHTVQIFTPIQSFIVARSLCSLTTCLPFIQYISHYHSIYFITLSQRHPSLQSVCLPSRTSLSITLRSIPLSVRSVLPSLPYGHSVILPSVSLPFLYSHYRSLQSDIPPIHSVPSFIVGMLHIDSPSYCQVHSSIQLTRYAPLQWLCHYSGTAMASNTVPVSPPIAVFTFSRLHSFSLYC